MQSVVAPAFGASLNFSDITGIVAKLSLASFLGVFCTHRGIPELLSLTCGAKAISGVQDLC